MEDDGLVAILIVRVHPAPDGGRPARARVTWRTDVDDPATEVVRPATSRAGVLGLVGGWLDAVGLPDEEADPGAGRGTGSGPGP